MNMADGLNMAPRPGEPESALVPGMSAPLVLPPAYVGGGLPVPSPSIMPGTGGPGLGPLQTPVPWVYDFTAAGVARATFNGVAAFAPDQAAGAWVPTLTFATPGNLNIVYGQQSGRWYRTGDLVTIWWNMTTTTFTHTSASGNLLIPAAPFTQAANALGFGAVIFQGITKAGYGTIIAELLGNGSIRFDACGSAQPFAAITTAEMPSAGTVICKGSLTYQALPA